jgi:M6 family metalloprotease-like protein
MGSRCFGPAIGLSILFACLMVSRPSLGDPPPPQKKGDNAAKGAVVKDAGKRGYVPRAGYLRSNRRLFLERKNAEKVRPGQNAAAPKMVRGTRSLPVILLDYKNVSAPFTADKYKEILFGDEKQKKTMSQYYRDQSQGRFRLSGQVLGWYTLPKDDTFYENNMHGGGSPFGEMLAFGLKNADRDVDFGLFDNDGLDGRPNSGDDDGIVDTVFFIHPEAGAECGGASENNIWSHSWHYDEPAYGHSGPYLTDDISKNSLGEPALNPDGSPKHIVVVDYTIQPGLSCNNDEHGGKKIIEIGVFCHEYGHALGLPDLYDRTPNGSPNSQGVGNYCLMAGGSYGGDGEHADTPSNMSAWCKYYLGWAPAVTITASGPVNFEPVQDGNTIYRLFIPGTHQQEYFLFEYRHNKWVDDVFALRLNWDEFLPQGGLAIWHIDERVGKDSGFWPFSPLDQGQNDAPIHVLSSPTRFGTPHPLVALVQADGRMDLERNVNRGDGSDLWDSGKSFIDDNQLLRGSRGFDSKPTGILLSDINLNSLTLNAAVSDNTVVSVAMQSSNTTLPSGAEGRGSSPEQPPHAKGASDRIKHLEGAKNKQILFDKLKRLDRLIDEKGTAALNDKIEQELKTVSESDIRAGIGSKNLSAVLAASAKARTEVVTITSKLEGKASSTLQKLVALGTKTKDAMVQYAAMADPSDERVERITNLSVPAAEGSPDRDAQARISGDLKPLFGNGVELVPASPGSFSSAAGPRRFQQVWSLGDEKLPIFGREAVLFYDEQNNLTAVTNSTVPAKLLQIDCRQDKLGPDGAVKLVAERLGVREKVITESPRKGIYLLDGDPQQGHVAYCVLFPAGELDPAKATQRPIEIYIDTETEETLKIQ